MRLAVIGAGSTGLSAARLLGQDPRHVTTVLETRECPPGPLDAVARLGVIVRPRAQVERLAVSAKGVDLWINGVAERFDLAVVTTSAAQTRALLVRSGLQRQVGSTTLARRVYVADSGRGKANGCARATLIRMAADHPGLRAGALTALPRESPVGQVLRALTQRAGALLAGHAEILDLSGALWPLEVPALYLAGDRRALDIVPGRLGVRHLNASGGGAADLEAGVSLGFVGADVAPAVVALATNAPIVPLATGAAHIAIGAPFYPETSSVEELMGDMRAVLEHLARADRVSLPRTAGSSPA